VSDKTRLFILSFLMLFIELALIRWLGSNIIYLSYFSNFVLLGSFLGIGVGFLRAQAKVRLFPWTPIALAYLTAFVYLFPVEIDRSGSDLIFFGNFTRTGLPTWITLPVIFIAVATVMAMVAEEVARMFIRFEPLGAYRLNIVGSIAGIAAFSLLSFTGAPPVVWGLIVGLTFVILYGRGITLLKIAAILCMLVILGKESMTAGNSWSPYYKVSTFPAGKGTIGVNVNGIPHQVIHSVKELHSSPYVLPYELARAHSFENVLIIGAGTGNDTAIALSEGAGHVDAVEIDPRLYQIGTQLHPNHPYDDPRVEVHIDDGRAFLERTNRQYDLIIFALPDSLTLVAGQSSLRLESYLFTIEAMRTARDHLRPDGVFAMYNFYREEWLINRLAHTLDLVYGHPPCLDSIGKVGRFAVLTTSPNPNEVQCKTTWQHGSEDPAPAIDDYPFLYLKHRGIPGFYLFTMAFILLTSAVMIRTAAGPYRAMAGYLDLFFMGAAFLLLETKNVVQFALLFGTTWLVNALVFTGILLSVLAAVEVACRVRFRRPGYLYAALLAALGLAWAIPPELLLALPVFSRFLFAILIAFAPVFLANLVFAQRFRDVASSAVAFGANLLGAMVGGLLEYGALVIGYQSLLLVVALLYGFAYLFGRRHLIGEYRPVVSRIPST
jgi:SAM-dependent methyltransferase